MSLRKEDANQHTEELELEMRLLQFQMPPKDRVPTKPRNEVAQTYRTGLIIGRFQPLHYGHIYLME